MAIITVETALPILVALALSALLYTTRRKASRGCVQLPGPSPASWLLGSWGQFLDTSSMELTDQWTAKYGAAFRYKGFFGADRLYISDPAAINHVVNAHFYRYPKAEVTRQRISRVLGDGLVWAEGDDHMRQRRIMTPSFIRARIRDQYHHFEEIATRLRETVRREIGGKSSAVLNMNDIISRATMDIILEAALDFPCNTLDNSDLEIANIYRGFMLIAQGYQSDMFKVWNEHTPLMPRVLQRMVAALPTARYSQLRHRKQVTRTFAENIVDTKIKEVLKGDTPANDALGTMIKANFAEKSQQRMTRDEIIEQVSTVVMAGHDTTAATLSWIFDTLSDQQEWQDKLRKAIWAFKAEHDEPTLDDYENFTLLNAILREGIRHQVTVPYLTRVCAEDDVIPLTHPIKSRNGKEITSIPISKRTRVDVGLGDYNHSTYIWGDDALEFKPERWMRPEGPVMPGVEEVPGHWNHLVTFITGGRTCLGFRFAVLEMQMFLCELIGSYKMERTPEAPKFFKPNTPIAQPFWNGKVQMPLIITPVKTPY